MASDAFVVGEDWISEHYFGTEQTKQSFQKRVLDRRKDWDQREAAGETTAKSRLAASRGALLKALVTFGSPTDQAFGGPAAGERFAREVLDPLAQALGYHDSLWRRQAHGPVTFLSPVHSDDSPAAALLFARPVSDLSDLLAKDELTLLEEFRPEGGDSISSVARALSWLFAGDEAPAFALVFSGSLALLAEKTRWAEGRYLTVDVQLVLDRADTAAVKKKGGEFDRAVAILAADSLLPDVDGSLWWLATLEESVKHTIGVSQDLRDGVRESIEIIANEVVRRRALGGLAPLPQAEANTLARQSLRYLYRILFLLYAEASPELGVLPVSAPEYAQGYGLDRLRELVLVELGEESRNRTHLYASLGTLFRLVDAGSEAVKPASDDIDDALPEGLEFQSLNADLFVRERTSLIDEVQLGDSALQRVLQLLLLTREEQTKKGRDRGFISYADLGINQLGSVYEGLMSYTGFFAEEDLFEVAKEGDAAKGSWVVPVSRSEHIQSQHFVLTSDPITGEKQRRRYQGGEFVYRLSGRARQQSASYYSPEVLTRFVVSQALEELLDQDDTRTSAAEILELSICEPALGSGAFAIEAVRQLSEQYLSRREEETGDKVDPDERPRELQKVKAQIALHQVYGVDLNDTAVELAEVSLWLDTMVEGLQAPWFGLRLRRGNSLIGARRAVYSTSQIDSKAWLHDVPTDVSVASLADEMRDGRVAAATSGSVHHFLLPAEGWGAACEAKEAKTLAPEAHKALRAWRTEMRRKPSKAQVKRLVTLGHRVETLWQFTLRRLEIAERYVQREVQLWNDPRQAESNNPGVSNAQTPNTTAQPSPSEHISRDDIETFLHDPEGAYQRLRRVMDAWSAMWFWPLTDTLTQGVTPPSLEQWIAGLEGVLGQHRELRPAQQRFGAQTLGLPTGWHDLAQAEELDLSFAAASPMQLVVTEHPWLSVTERISAEQGFFHWELDFASVFARGGFDLQVGNPPWVRPRSDVDALLAEGDPWWQLANKPTQAEVKVMRERTLRLEGISDLVLDGTADVASTAEFVGSSVNYPHLAGLQPDLYRCFIELVWRHSSKTGISSLIHPDTHYTDDKAARLRQASYSKLRRVWLFANRFQLFDIGAVHPFSVNIYGGERAEPAFLLAASLFHPETVLASQKHDGSGPPPGVKTVEGQWDSRPHLSRIIHVDRRVLTQWARILGDEETTLRDSARMVTAVNREVAAVGAKLATSTRLGDLQIEFSRGWDENLDRVRGRFDVEWGPVDSWRDVILQGPHFFVSTPFFKEPNPSMRSKSDWKELDLEVLAPESIPVTRYKPSGDREDYDSNYGQWGSQNPRSARDFFRIAWRTMTDNVGIRSLIPAIIPPGPTHVHAVGALGLPGAQSSLLFTVQGLMSSLLADFAVRSVPKSSINPAAVSRLPFQLHPALETELILRAARLSVLTGAYAPLWSELSVSLNGADQVRWAGGIDYENRRSLHDVGEAWSIDVPLRRASDRRQAQLEIDVIVAISLCVSADELSAVYRTQFPVLYGYDRNSYFYDANGRLVPQEVLRVWKQKGEAITQEERIAVHPGSGIAYEYELPFITLDREADMRRAYAHFERLLEE